MAATVAEHRKAVTELVRAAVQRNGRQDDTVGLLEARNRILARDISAPVSLPPFANSQMDGYAVDSAAAGGRPEFAVAETIAALYAPHALVLSPVEHAAFAGNAIALSEDVVWMSAAAGRALTATSRDALAMAGFGIRTVELDAIEAGGGSLRCCVGEIY